LDIGEKMIKDINTVKDLVVNVNGMSVVVIVVNIGTQVHVINVTTKMIKKKHHK
jgi:hypothetical protein